MNALQRCMIGFEGATLPPHVSEWLRDGLAGIFLFPPNGNLVTAGQVRALCAAIHEQNPRCIIAIDEEGGRVQAWGPPHFAAQPTARALGTRPDTEIEAQGKAIGDELRALGVDLNFAPVVDVDTMASNPIIGDRSFSSDAREVTRAAAAFALGLHRAGVLSCGKHFPGHGDTRRDSHLELPVVERALATLLAVELAPFAALLDTLPALMTAHVVYPALDARCPATHSRKILVDLLRGELGFRGVLFSDDLAMKGIRQDCGLALAATRALAAGCDLVLSAFECDEHREMFAAIDAELTAGRLERGEHAAAVARIDAMSRRFN